MAQFFKAFLFLAVMLCLLMTGIDFALDRAARSGSSSEFAVYHDQGSATEVYVGPVDRFPEVAEINSATMPRLLRRGHGPIPLTQNHVGWL